MMIIRDTQVNGLSAAIYSMRNPYDSWAKSDTKFSQETEIGKEDLKLCRRLISAGSDHRKFLRMIHVQALVKAPLYWWKQYDTYKIGTTTNSCSTMHTIHKKKFSIDDFSFDDDCEIYHTVVDALNGLRNKYLLTDDTTYWRAIIQLLPSAYNQTRSIDIDFETLIRIYNARKTHRLHEWRSFCEWIISLPYMPEFLI